MNFNTLFLKLIALYLSVPTLSEYLLNDIHHQKYRILGMFDMYLYTEQEKKVSTFSIITTSEFEPKYSI